MNLNEKQRLYIDMDGTLTVFTPVNGIEQLYEKGYFENLLPHINVLQAIKIIIKEYPEIEVNILSAYLVDSAFALEEKNKWLDKHLPEVEGSRRIFCPCGSDKKEFIQGGIKETDFLFDDYTKNLNSWFPQRAIKLLNDINHTRESWSFNRLRFDKSPYELSKDLVKIIKNREIIKDDKPERRFANMRDYILEIESQRIKKECFCSNGTGNSRVLEERL